MCIFAHKINNAYLYRDASLITESTEYLGEFEVLGDTESGNNIDNHFAIMYAMWQVNTYKVNLNINASQTDSTVANYSGIQSGSCESGLISISLNIVFDTNVWYYDGTFDLTDIVLEKFGYPYSVG